MGHALARTRSLRLSGFTLVEALIVLVLLSLAAAAAFSSGAPTHLGRVELAAEEVASALRFARDESLRTGEVYGVRIQALSDRVRVFRADLSADPPDLIYDVYHPVTRQLWDVQFSTHRAIRGVDITRSLLWSDNCGRAGRIAFRDGGTPSCTDPLGVLLESGTITLALGGLSRQVAVDGYTGRVTGP